MENSREELRTEKAGLPYIKGKQHLLTPSFYTYVIHKLLHENGKVIEESLRSGQKENPKKPKKTNPNSNNLISMKMGWSPKHLPRADTVVLAAFLCWLFKAGRARNIPVPHAKL